MNEEADDDISGEVEVNFTSRMQSLTKLGISLAEFEAALLFSLEERDVLAARDDIDDSQIPFLEEMEITIGGVVYKLEDLADVEIRG